MARNSGEIHIPDFGVSPGVDSEEVESLRGILEESKEELNSSDAPPIKKKRGPYKKRGSTTSESEGPTAPPPAPSGPSPFLPQLVVFSKMPFAAVAEVKERPHWEIGDAEATAIATAADQCLQAYMPDLGNSKWGPLFALTFTVAMVTLPRYAEDRRIERARNVTPKIENQV